MQHLELWTEDEQSAVLKRDSAGSILGAGESGWMTDMRLGGLAAVGGKHRQAAGAVGHDRVAGRGRHRLTARFYGVKPAGFGVECGYTARVRGPDYQVAQTCQSNYPAAQVSRFDDDTIAAEHM